MRVLLTGASGMLGSAFFRALGDEAIVVPRGDLDIRDIGKIEGLVGRAGAEVVVNCAAHVNPEIVEGNPDPAYSANTLLPALLAMACRRASIALVHFSSTGCYGAWKSTPYTEEDRLEPTTVHHRSKISGENAIRDSGCEHLILRLGWLFGGNAFHTKNFVWRRLLEASSSDRISSDTTQRGSPTHVDDVAEHCLRLIRLGLRGTYNCVAQGEVTRFDYVSRIVEAARLDCQLEPVYAFKRSAPVSPNEAAINYRLRLLGLDEMPLWSVSLDRYVARVLQWPEWKDHLERALQRL